MREIDPASRSLFFERMLDLQKEGRAGSLLSEGLRDEVLADGKVTEEERAGCRAVLTELKLPRELVPPDFQALL